MEGGGIDCDLYFIPFFTKLSMADRKAKSKIRLSV
jgi:hypothetical protein